MYTVQNNYNNASFIHIRILHTVVNYMQEKRQNNRKYNDKGKEEKGKV